MASYRYTKDIQPEDVKPQEEKQLSKKDKLKNFIYYHKFALIAIPLAAVFAVWAIVDLFTTPKPDYVIAVLSENTIDSQFLDQLQSKLAPYGEDVNGDGKILLFVNNYVIPSDTGDAGSASTGAMQLQADLETGSSVIFLCENPQYIQEQYGIFTDISAPLSTPVTADIPPEKYALSFSEACKDKISFTDYYVMDLEVDAQKTADSLFFCLRYVKGSRLENDEQFNSYYEACIRLLESLSA